MAAYEVRFLQEALADVEGIVLYIAQDNRQAALHMYDKIIEKVNNLTLFPNRGRFVPDKKMAAAGYKMLIIKPYIAFYRLIGRYVFIYRILHGAVNYPRLYEKMSQVDGGEGGLFEQNHAAEE